ncbi:hypothetical protein [Chryseobacterium sp. MEBOG07]|uniref:hypothetical protein n=1 Tax=Chryseobacterium sp. MEBOG07 TaxID=2879939 RepID=UPI001F45CF91|nr:hypothetical protein [Chryseobacterium sp. MEBOG07]UKB79567.1 hypothetical protein LF886_00740 [Chryseobacterium sp. MEBOG07]
MKIITFIVLTLLVSSCNAKKTVFAGQKVYKYVNRQGQEDGKDQIIEYTVTKKFATVLNDRTTRFEIPENIKENISQTDIVDVEPENVVLYKGMENIYYTSEVRKFANNKYFEQKPFHFYYSKFSLTALTVPLKFRKGIGDELLNPPNVETGFNVNFAPAYRLNYSSFNPSKKFLGSNITNYSITFGGIFGIGGVDLKTKSNAPGLISDRKSAAFTYGGTVIFGLNSIGLGYAFGFDNVLGTGRKYWVYQNKIWHGIIVSVDLIK